MVPSVIKCDSCGFKGDDEFWGSYVYNLEGMLADIPRSTGWCFDCRSTATIEDRPSFSSWHKSRPPVQVEETPPNEWLESLVAPPQKKSLFSRLFGKRKLTEKDKKRIARDRQRTLEEQESDGVLGVSLKRPDKTNRCLICGGTSVKLFNDQSTRDPSTEWPHFRHPECGGALYSKRLRIHVHPSLRRRHYSTDGDYQFEERLDLGKELFKGTGLVD